MIKILYRLYLLFFGPIIFVIAGLLIILQVIISPAIWVFTGKGTFSYDPIGIIVLKKLSPPIYNYIDQLCDL